MKTENQVETVATTETTATETESPELVTQEVEANAEQQAEPEGDEAEKALKRMQRRIDKRTGDYHRTKAENDQLRERLAALEAQSGKAEGTQGQDGEADTVTLAREIARVERFTEKANAMVEQGTKKHPDYMVALKDLAAEVGPFVVKNGAPSPFMEVVLEVAEKPTELLYHLGKNPELAEELAGLTQIKLAKKLASIESALADKSNHKSSNAPKPLEAVSGSTKKTTVDTFQQAIENARRGYMNLR